MKRVIRIFIALIGIYILGLTGWYIGAQLGGNYFENFQLGSTRGYEATGALGFWIGIVVGVILLIVTFRKPMRSKHLSQQPPAETKNSN